MAGVAAKLGVAFALAAACAAALLSDERFLLWLLPDIEAPASELRNLHNLDMLVVHPKAPQRMFENGQYNYGRFKQPVLSPQLHPLGFAQSIAQRKQWHFTSITIDNFLIGLVVADIGYVGSSFVYIYDASTGESDQTSQLFPFGFGASIAESSTSGCSTWSPLLSDLNVSQCATSNGWDIKFSGTLQEGSRVDADIQLAASPDNFAMVYPMGPRRAAYTHKVAGLQVSGTLQSSKFNVPLSLANDAAGLIDWTRSMHRRMTVWWWAALSFVSSSGNRVGLQFSSAVYTDEKGNALENAMWVAGKMVVLDEAIEWTGTPGSGVLDSERHFRISTKSGSVNLEYQKEGSVDSIIEAGVLKGSLLHTFGRYTGTLRVFGEEFHLTNRPGILEDHYALW